MNTLPTSLPHRFDYAANLERAGSHGMATSALWPTAASYMVHSLDLSPYAAGVAPAVLDELALLARLVEREWFDSQARPFAHPAGWVNRTEIAGLLYRLAGLLDGADREALRARAQYLAEPAAGALPAAAYHATGLTIFVGDLATWFGKEIRRRPSAFACRRQADLEQTLCRLTDDTAALTGYFGLLHKALAVLPAPAFVPAELFFMAGEANRHPKHIAYFFPEDEGVKGARRKQTVYFTNTHLAKLDDFSWPLFDQLVPDGVTDAAAARANVRLPASGVLAHELGHFVQCADTRYGALNRQDRWASVVLQETAADVFGTLILAEVWAARIGATPQQVIAYYLAECLHYVSRGSGLFPDSDGMLLQLNYLCSMGVLRPVGDGAALHLVVDTSGVIAALRSLARVMADTLLAGDVTRTLALHRRYGPAGTAELAPLLAHLRQRPPFALDYLQQYAFASAVPAGSSVATSPLPST